MTVELGRGTLVASLAVEEMVESSLEPDLWPKDERSDDEEEEVVDTERGAG